MTAKEYLKQLWLIDKEINSKLRELEYLRTKAENCSSPEMTGMPRSAGGKDKISSVIIKLVELEKYINARTDRLIDLRRIITKQIDGLSSQKSRIILSARYLRQQKWEDIEEELSYEKTTIMRWHRAALREFEYTYPEIRRMK